MPIDKAKLLPLLEGGIVTNSTLSEAAANPETRVILELWASRAESVLQRVKSVLAKDSSITP